VDVVWGVVVNDGSGDWFTVHMNAEVEIVGLNNIVTSVRLLPYLTKIQVYFLQDHGHRLPLLPTPP
jgi:hypothetical protein